MLEAATTASRCSGKQPGQCTMRQTDTSVYNILKQGSEAAQDIRRGGQQQQPKYEGVKRWRMPHAPARSAWYQWQGQHGHMHTPCHWRRRPKSIRDITFVPSSIARVVGALAPPQLAVEGIWQASECSVYGQLSLGCGTCCADMLQACIRVRYWGNNNLLHLVCSGVGAGWEAPML
jgi:hypothetical protein